MRYAVALAIMAGLGWLAHHQAGRADAAATILAKAEAMDTHLGDEAAEVGYRVVAERFPFSAQAVDARRRLFRLQADVGPSATQGPGLGTRLGDRLWGRGDPHVGGLALAVLALLVALHSLLDARSRARGRALLLLLATTVAIALTQTAWGQGQLARSRAEDVYAAFPWIAAGALLLSVFTLLGRHVPRARTVGRAR